MIKQKKRTMHYFLDLKEWHEPWIMMGYMEHNRRSINPRR